MGTSLAVVGAYVLANEMRRAGGDYATAFTRYQQLLAPYVARCQKLAVANLKMDRFSSGWIGRLRNVGLQFLRVPAIRNLVIKQSLAVGRSFTLPSY
jgi:2-polyprenyl-6-methoxyphenol hydroxylase-like FAD-dependent oxidoreductase